MIISASRRTDIPAFYSDWLFNRVKDGYVMVRNPMNFHQISKISLSPEVVDGIVFWTKNPAPMIEKLRFLSSYTYYFQFTITPYKGDIEPVLDKKKVIDTFKKLSDSIGPEKVIWRYDPILLNSKYSFNYHIKAFENLSKQLQGYTNKCTISFIDTEYRNVKKNVKFLDLLRLNTDFQRKISRSFSTIAKAFNLTIETCAEKIDLSEYGIKHGHCIDKELFEKLLGCKLNIKKDKSQRSECGCVSSIDIGSYNTCNNRCLYCYANYNQGLAITNFNKHNPSSPLISGNICKNDVVKIREIKSCCISSISLFS